MIFGSDCYDRPVLFSPFLAVVKFVIVHSTFYAVSCFSCFRRPYLYVLYGIYGRMYWHNMFCAGAFGTEPGRGVDPYRVSATCSGALKRGQKLPAVKYCRGWVVPSNVFVWIGWSTNCTSGQEKWCGIDIINWRSWEQGLAAEWAVLLNDYLTNMQSFCTYNDPSCNLTVILL